MEEEIIIGVTGSVHYQNATTIKQCLFKIRENLGTTQFKIASCGNSDGADRYIKKIALEFDLPYAEYTDFWKQHNVYTILSKNFYNKLKLKTLSEYRNKFMVKGINYLIYFGVPNKEDDKWLIDLIIKCDANNKKTLQIK